MIAGMPESTPSSEPTKDQIIATAKAAIARGDAPLGNESDIVRVFLETHACGVGDERLPLHEADTILCEQVLRYGRADIVVYHVDGSISVIEAKDGSNGYSAVVAGIGQATLYATQLGQAKGVARCIRRCLLWSSTGDLMLDVLIEDACQAAGVVSLSMASARLHATVREITIKLHEEAKNGCTEEG